MNLRNGMKWKELPLRELSLVMIQVESEERDYKVGERDGS